jgi:uncharacterized protein YcbX
MTVVGKVDGLWRYPVKSMRGEELEEAFLGFSGIYGDRLFAFKSAGGHKGFPYLTGREQKEMLLYRPRFRHPSAAAKPVNLAEAESVAPGATPLYADPAELMVDVEMPSGDVLAVDDRALLRILSEKTGPADALTLLRSERAMTDCRPVSLFGVETARQLGNEIGAAVDPRRFRANIYGDFGPAPGFIEDTFVGRTLRIGSKAVISILERDPRCKMIALDPDTAEPNPDVLRTVARAHEGKAGVYGAVLVEGTMRRGDPIELLS